MNSVIPMHVSVVCGIPLRFELNFNYSENSKQKTIQEIACTIAEIYTKFLMLTNEERQILYNQNVLLLQLKDSEKKSLSSPEKIKEFQNKLTTAIIDDLNSETLLPSHITTLFVDHGPMKILSEICEAVFDNNLYFAFPGKTTTSIYLNKKTSTITVDLNFQTRLSAQRSF